MDSQQQQEPDITTPRGQVRAALEIVAQQLDPYLAREEPVAVVIVAATRNHMFVMAPTSLAEDDTSTDGEIVGLLNKAIESLLMGNSDERSSVPL